ncbi:MAG: sigma-70 family RNA polymerase sigma factor [Polyangiaceae bacterium]
MLRLFTVTVPFLARARADRAGDVEARLRWMVSEHVESLWRFLRRLGVREGDIDDAMQEIICVAARRDADIEPGKEKSFLFGTAFRIASELRRKGAYRHESSEEAGGDPEDPAPGPDELTDQAHARVVLDGVLDGMPLDLRAVFVLYELEEHTMSEISGLLGLAPGTVASRLRRARTHFDEAVAAWQASSLRKEDAP